MLLSPLDRHRLSLAYVDDSLGVAGARLPSDDYLSDSLFCILLCLRVRDWT